MARFLTEEETKYVLAIDEDDITKDNIIKWFAIQKATKPMFSTNDKFRLPAGKLYNDSEIVTTVGRFIFNKVHQQLMDHLKKQRCAYSV